VVVLLILVALMLTEYFKMMEKMISVKRGKDTGLGRNLKDGASVMMAAVVYANLDWYEVVEIICRSV